MLYFEILPLLNYTHLICVFSFLVKLRPLATNQMNENMVNNNVSLNLSFLT